MHKRATTRKYGEEGSILTTLSTTQSILTLFTLPINQEYVSAYQMKNYPDSFSSLPVSKYMVKKLDGTIKLFDDAELTELNRTEEGWIN